MARLLHLLPLLVAPVVAIAQGVAPVVTAGGGFEVFDQGRFIGLDDRAPEALARSGGSLLFVDHEGVLHRVEQGQVRRQDEGAGIAPLAAAGTLFWTSGEALHRAHAQSPERLSAAVGTVTAADSLLVYHDRERRAVMAWWRGRTIEVAGMDSATGRAPWAVGSNTLVFHDRYRSRVMLLYRGQLRLLFDGTATAEVSPGGDLVACWDDHRGVFCLWERGRTVALEPLRPLRFIAGNGVLAWVSAGGTFKVWCEGRVRTVLDHAPSDLWVHDSLVVFVEGGGLHAVGPDGPERVEPYVPESWWVEGGVLTYLDLDRGIRQWHAGARTLLAPGMATRRFEVHGDVVVWTGTDGVTRCWWRGRTYER